MSDPSERTGATTDPALERPDARPRRAIAHDLNNLMTAVVGHASLLDMEIGPDHPAAPDVAAIQAAGERATVLIAELGGWELLRGARRPDAGAGSGS